MPECSDAGIAVLVPARDAAEHVAATVRAVRGIAGVRHVVVVDDGSLDATARRAVEAGAQVLRHPRPRGPAAALITAADRVARLDAEAGLPPSLLLLVDARLGESAAAASALVAPVAAGEAEMAVAVRPSGRPVEAGGLAVRLARLGIARATGFRAVDPLSPARCLTGPAFEAARPLAPGAGTGTALTIDLLLAGYRVSEVPCELPDGTLREPTGEHRRSSPRSMAPRSMAPRSMAPRSLAAQLHRARQLRDVSRALVVRRLRRALPLRLLRLLRLLQAPRR